MSSSASSDFTDYINGSFMMDHMDKLEAESDEEITLAFKNLGKSVMQEYPAKVVSDYRKAADATAATWDALAAEWEMALSGAKLDSTDFYNAYDDHQAELDALHPLNNDHCVAIDWDVARKIGALLLVVSPLSGYGAKFSRLGGQIAQLQAKLEKLKKKIRSKQTKLALDAALNTLILFASPTTMGGRLTVVVYKTVASQSISSVFGSGRPPQSQKDAYSTATSLLTISGKLSGIPAKAMGALTGFGQLALDAEEVAEAQKLKATIDKEIKTLVADFEAAKKDFVRQTKGLKKLLDEAQRSYDQAVKRVGNYSQASSAVVTKKKVVSTLKAMR